MPSRAIARVLERLREDRLRDIAVVELRILRELDIPLLKLVAGLTEEEVVAQVMAGLEKFIRELAAGKALESARESVARWEAGEMQGVGREDVKLIDLIGVYSAQKRAILSQLPKCGVALDEAMAFTDHLLDTLMRIKEVAFGAYDRIHREAVARRAKAEAEKALAEEYAGRLAHAHEELQSVHEELQAANEELTSQGEELQAQQEELADLTEQLWKRNEAVEAEILERTAQLLAEMAENARLQAEKIEALERAGAVKDQFLAMVSHELRTPLNAITGFGSILQDEVAGPLSERQQAYLTRMLRGADMLLVLVDDLLDMSRIQAGKFALEIGPVSCNKVAEKVAQMLQPMVDQRQQSLQVDLPVKPVELLADERRIGQVLFNLLHNAIKFTPEGGRIMFRSRIDGEFLRFEVEDTGPGIPESEVQRVFERFTQLDMSSTRPTGGAGLGLSISKALIEAHRGEIGIRPGTDRGAIVWFLLPLKPGASRVG